jgi:hypothetical protein
MDLEQTLSFYFLDRRQLLAEIQHQPLDHLVSIGADDFFSSRRKNAGKKEANGKNKDTHHLDPIGCVQVIRSKKELGSLATFGPLLTSDIR